MSTTSNKHIFTLNGGSSSIKFSLYSSGSGLREEASGKVDGIGTEHSYLEIETSKGNDVHQLGKADLKMGLEAIERTVGPIIGDSGIDCVGHRIVHGGPEHDAPAVLDADMLKKLEEFTPFAPLHQPHNLNGVRAAMSHFPNALQIGCFDTAFHRNRPWVTEAYALPRRYYDMGVRRYGFHGISYTYISQKLAELDPQKGGRAVVCHLGSGASLCAMRDGKSVDNSMGFSALEGLPMGTRCGQIDPGVLLFLLDQENMTSKQITDMLYKQSGLLGLSNVSNDMRDLAESSKPEAQQAIDYFVFRICREIGAMAATLGGLDTLVFCAGIGESSAMIRERVCSELGWMGVELDPDANQQNASVISRGKTTVRVIHTDEERVMAEACASFMGQSIKGTVPA